MLRSCLSRFVSLVAGSILFIAPLVGFSEQPRSRTGFAGADAQLKRVLEKGEQPQLGAGVALAK